MGLLPNPHNKILKLSADGTEAALSNALSLEGERYGKTPDLIAVLHCLLEHDTAGDPMTGLRWSRRTTSTIAEELAKLGIAVSPNSVARLLYDMDYSLRVNHKQNLDQFEPPQKSAVRVSRRAEPPLPASSSAHRQRGQQLGTVPTVPDYAQFFVLRVLL